jgi:hypothetical protein
MQMKWGEEEALQLQEEGKTENASRCDNSRATVTRHAHNNPQREERKTEIQFDY